MNLWNCPVCGENQNYEQHCAGCGVSKHEFVEFLTGESDGESEFDPEPGLIARSTFEVSEKDGGYVSYGEIHNTVTDDFDAYYEKFLTYHEARAHKYRQMTREVVLFAKMVTC